MKAQSKRHYKFKKKHRIQTLAFENCRAYLKCSICRKNMNNNVRSQCIDRCSFCAHFTKAYILFRRQNFTKLRVDIHYTLYIRFVGRHRKQKRELSNVPTLRFVDEMLPTALRDNIITVVFGKH